jgi:hypothetical protein
LHNENIRTADVFVDADEHLTIGKSIDGGLAEINTEVARNGFCERPIPGPRKDPKPMHWYRQAVHDLP